MFCFQDELRQFEGDVDIGEQAGSSEVSGSEVSKQIQVFLLKSRY